MLNLGQSAFLRNRKNKVRKTVLKIPTKQVYIRKASSKVLEALRAYSLNEDRMFDIRLCVEEAMRNAMVHGNHNDKHRTVRVAYWIRENKLNIEVEDEGSGFDYKALPDPTAGDNLMKGSGRGVYLIKNLMDEIKFNECGNKIKMVKYL